MRVLAVASQKGGSGKTTLSGHLAVQAQLAGAGPVVLIDIDPQGSLPDWWNERDTDYPAFAQPTVARLAADLGVLRQQGFKLAKFGRASCMEKVCLYVYIFVVGDSYIKKHLSKHQCSTLR